LAIAIGAVVVGVERYMRR